MDKTEYEKNPKLCQHCNTKITFKKRKNKFCGHSCSAKHNNRGVRRNGTKPIHSNCLNCGEDLSKSGKHYRERKYCSVQCQMAHAHQMYIKRWKDGTEDGCIGNHGATSNHIRRYLFEKYENKCCICGWNERSVHTNSIPLQIDHIDGNHENNDENNIRLLCPNCHSLTPTYGSLNNGYCRNNRH